MSRVIKVCKHCGSENVTYDALVMWNVATQQWELESILDNADCGACGGETTVEDEELE